MDIKKVNKLHPVPALWGKIMHLKSEEKLFKQWKYFKGQIHCKILSCASEVGSPTNHPGSRQQQDMGPGILWSVHRWMKPNNLVVATYKIFKKNNGPYIRPVLLRQGKPGTSQYNPLIIIIYYFFFI